KDDQLFHHPQSNRRVLAAVTFGSTMAAALFCPHFCSHVHLELGNNCGPWPPPRTATQPTGILAVSSVMSSNARNSTFRTRGAIARARGSKNPPCDYDRSQQGRKYFKLRHCPGSSSNSSTPNGFTM